jgi:hypothetical protein
MTSFSSYNFPPVTELVFPTEWESTDHDDKMMFAETEDLLTYQPSSHHVLGGSQWEDYQDANADQDMQTDGDNIFPTRPLEELFNNALYFDNDDDDDHHHNHNHNIHYQAGQDQFLDPLMNDGVDTTDHDLLLCDDDDSSTASIGLPLEERYKATLEKLQASMKRSQETRNCLSMKTVTTESYERVGSVKEILSSITASSNQVQKYVTSIQRPL